MHKKPDLLNPSTTGVPSLTTAALSRPETAGMILVDMSQAKHEDVIDLAALSELGDVTFIPIDQLLPADNYFADGYKPPFTDEH